jgi:fatty-acyl-CoA synthase
MLGLMQDHPLLISGLIRHAAENHGSRAIVSRLVDGSIHRSDYAMVERRARQLANALSRRGYAPGDRIATLAWNTYRHLECFYGVSGMGAILHTVNPRLFREQISYIIRHASGRVLLFDADLLPIVEAIAPEIGNIEAFVALTDRAGLPASSLKLEAYEDWLSAGSTDYLWPTLDERQASSLCYTSGTTGNPKGVLYSHRSTVLHAMAACQSDCFAIGALDTVMPIAPLFHANAWSMPYCCPMVGAKLVLPGNRNDATSLYQLLSEERVTFAVAVPTIWNLLLAWLESQGKRLTDLRRCLIGGTALSGALKQTLQEHHGIEVLQAWGMTETSPVGTMAAATAGTQSLPESERAEELLKQGRVPFGVQMQIRDSQGQVVPRDGKTFGPIWVRGPWVASGYFKSEAGPALDAHGWFPTGDVGTWDRFGFMKITDRTKDVIKSGGEWISSIDVENAAMAHPQVSLAATIAAFHPKWDERPLLVVVPKDDAQPAKQEILDFLRPRMAKWWLPDDIVFVKQMPMTATGKILKSSLREQYWRHLVDSPSKESDA